MVKQTYTEENSHNDQSFSYHGRDITFEKKELPPLPCFFPYVGKQLEGSVSQVEANVIANTDLRIYSSFFF